MATGEKPVVLYEKPLEGTEDEYEEDERIVAPDGGWGWIVVISGFFAHVLSDGVMYAFGVILEELMDVFNATATDISFAGSLLPGVILGIGPIASTLITIYGARSITIAGAVIASASLVASCFAPSLIVLTITAGVCCGVGFGIVYLPAIVMVSYYFESRRSIAMGLTVVGSGIGAMLFPPLLRFLIKMYGWRGTFLVMGGLVLNCVCCGLVLLPLKPQKIWVRKRSNTTSTNQEDLAHIIRLSEEDSKQTESVDIVDNVEDDRFYSSQPVIRSELSLAINSQGDMNTLREEQDEERECISPLLGSRKTSEHNLSVPRDEVRLRRGMSHSPGRVTSHYEDERAMNTPNGLGALSARGSFRHKKLSHHQSQLLPSQRRNPDLIMRPDLRYPASLTNIPLYQSNRELYVHQVSHYASRTDLDDDVEEEETSLDEKPSKCEVMLDSLKNSFDFTLFTDIPFLVFTMSSFITSLGYNAPYIYIVSWGTDLNFDKSQASILSSCIGVGNIIGRLFFGFVADVPRVSRILLYIIALALCGAVTIISPMFTNYFWMVGFAVSFGILIGAYISLTPLLIVDLLGLHRLEVAFGILGLFQCIATLIGPPVLAALRDYTGSYSILFVCCGAVTSFSGLMLLPVYFCYDKMRGVITIEERELGRAENFFDTHSEIGDPRDSLDDNQQRKIAAKI